MRLTSLTTGASLSSAMPAPAVCSVSVKSMAVSVNSASIESTDSVSRLAVVPVDGLDDLLAWQRAPAVMSLFRMNWSFCDGVEVGRVAHDDLEHAVFLRQRQDDVFAGHRLGHQFDDGGRDGDVGQVDELQAVELGDGRHDLFLVA